MPRRRSRSLRGLGGSPTEHAEKAFNAANKAIMAFSRVVKDDKMNCRDKLALYTGGVAQRGQFDAHHYEARGTKISAPDRSESMRLFEYEAFDAVNACFPAYGTTKPFSGMRRRRSRK